MKIMEIQDLDSSREEHMASPQSTLPQIKSDRDWILIPMKSVHAHHRSSQNTLWLSFTDLLRTWRTNKPAK